jgi:hypothetical protein
LKREENGITFVIGSKVRLCSDRGNGASDAIHSNQ